MIEILWLWAGRLTTLFALLGAVFAVWAWLKATELLATNRRAAKRRRAKITLRFVCLKDDGKSQCAPVDLPYKPRRDQLSRAELAGIISFYYGEPRFDPSILRRVMEDGSLNRVLAGEMDDSDADETLVIPCEEVFLDQIRQQIQKHDGN